MLAQVCASLSSITLLALISPVSRQAELLPWPGLPQVNELRRCLMTSKNQMAAVAGLLQYPVHDLPAEGTDPTAAEPVVDVFEEAFRHQTFVELSGHISEVALLISGRQPEIWWPSEAPPPGGSPAQSRSISRQASKGSRQPSFSGASPNPTPASGALHAAAAAVAAAAAGGEVADLVTLEEEAQLIALRFMGAAVSVEVSSDFMRVETLMRSLDIVDLLVGAKCPAKGHMARSTPVNAGGWQLAVHPQCHACGCGSCMWGVYVPGSRLPGCRVYVAQSCMNLLQSWNVNLF